MSGDNLPPPPAPKYPTGIPDHHWTIWDPIPPWLEVRSEIRQQIFVISLEIAQRHLALEQEKIDRVKALFTS